MSSHVTAPIGTRRRAQPKIPNVVIPQDVAVVIVLQPVLHQRIQRLKVNVIHAEGVAAEQNDCLHHDPSQHRDLPAGKPFSASDGNPWKPCVSLLRLEHVVGHSRRANPGYLSRVPTGRPGQKDAAHREGHLLPRRPMKSVAEPCSLAHMRIRNLRSPASSRSANCLSFAVRLGK